MSSSHDLSNLKLRYDELGGLEDIFLSVMKDDEIVQRIQIVGDSRPQDVPTQWQKEIERIHNAIDKRTLAPEDKTEKAYFKWVMARNDIRERITSWLDLTKKKGKQSLKDPGKAKQYKDEGNSFFKKQDYASSVESYTQSARYATFENNDFSVAIANRSAAFCHLGRYEESLQDIKLAIDCGYPAASLWKLHLRAVECHVALGDNKLAQEALDRLSESLDQNPDAASSMKTTILKRAKDLMAGKPKKNGGIAKCSNSDAIINPETMLPKNEEFPFASPSLVLKTCPKRGRHVVATKRIKKGELLFVEKPFAWVPVTHGNDAQLCAHCCGPMDDSKIPCKGCLEAFYCGRTCWQDSWPYHQWECPGYHMNLWQQVGVSHLAFKMMIVATTSSDIRWFNDVQKMVTNADKTKSADMLGLAIASLMVIIFLEKYTNFFQTLDIKKVLVDKFDDESLSLSDIDLSTIEGKKLYVGTIVYRHSLQMLINAYAVTRIGDSAPATWPERPLLATEQQRLATGSYPSSSMLNHSCDPTVMNTFWKNWLIVKSLKDVAPGQEIFNCYGPHFRRMPRSERLTTLNEQYYFHCECEICADPRFDSYTERFKGLKCKRCSGPAQLLEETDTQRCFDCGATSPVNFRDALERASRFFEDADKLFDSDNPKSAIALYKKSLAIREKYLWKYNADLANTFCLLGQTHALSGDCLGALSYAEKGFLGVQEKYGRESIEVANELNALTDVIILYLERTSDRTTDVYRETLKKGQEYVNRMGKIIGLAGGPWCDLYQDVKEKEERLNRIDQWLRALESPIFRAAFQSSLAGPKPKNK